MQLVQPISFTYTQRTVRHRCPWCNRRHRMYCCQASRSVRACIMLRTWACTLSTCPRIIMDHHRPRMRPLQLLPPPLQPLIMRISWRPLAAVGACCICITSIISMRQRMQHMRHMRITINRQLRQQSITVVHRHHRRPIITVDRRRVITMGHLCLDHRVDRRRCQFLCQCRRIVAMLALHRLRIERAPTRHHHHLPDRLRPHWAAVQAPSVHPIRTSIRISISYSIPIRIISSSIPSRRCRRHCHRRRITILAVSSERRNYFA